MVYTPSLSAPEGEFDQIIKTKKKKEDCMGGNKMQRSQKKETEDKVGCKKERKKEQ